MSMMINSVLLSILLSMFVFVGTFVRSNASLSPTCHSDCNSTCQVCQNGRCVIDKNSCYIAGQCYKKNQTSLRDSLSCLQCQPNRIQTQWSFNPQCSAGIACQNKLFLEENTCPLHVIAAFYFSSNPINTLYNFRECGQDRKQCQSGFFLLKSQSKPLACCPGYFCPDGQICMIPCRPGSYCPSPLKPANGTCQTPVKCPAQQLGDFDDYGCGGSTFEGFCPSESYCPKPDKIFRCPNKTSYCPTGVQKPLSCPSHFLCLNGRASRRRLRRSIIVILIVIFIAYAISAKISEWLILKKKLFGQYTSDEFCNISDYFKERNESSELSPQLQLNIHLHHVKLRNVTRFDPLRNEGFTGRIAAGKLTAFMGGSGCGKSSLLETIYGRRRPHKNGSVTFAEHDTLSNALTQYVGYVPQTDIMHDDLTVFETVYYSARTRRLDDPKRVIISDVCFVLEKLGLKNMHNSMTKTLSGGQRKRVNVAIEVVACPKVLLLDEPTSGLDTASCDDLFDLLQLIKYNATGPVTIIMVIHQPSQELFEKIDDIFFLTPLCCLAYQGPREQAKEYLRNVIFSDPQQCPSPRHNDCDTCFIMLTKAQNHINNHSVDNERSKQILSITSWNRRVWLSFYYVLLRTGRQNYIRGAVAEATYLFAYFLLGACVGYLFSHKQGSCSINSLSIIFFLITLAFGILTCISSQRLFGVETTDQTFVRESRNYFHPFQYWLAKSLVDTFRLILYPLLFLSILYIEIIPRGAFSYYFGVMFLLSFVCTGIGQFTSVFFNRTEYAYLAGTIAALLSCLLSGFGPTKKDLGRGGFIIIFSFSRHVQNLLFVYETNQYIKADMNITQTLPHSLEAYLSYGRAIFNMSNVRNGIEHLWYPMVHNIAEYYSFSESENSYFWLVFLGCIFRVLTIVFLYAKSEYRSKTRYNVTHARRRVNDLFSCKLCRKRSST